MHPPRLAPIPRFAVISGALYPIEPCRLPALPGSEVRGLLLQGLTRIGRVRAGDPPPFTITPRPLDDTAAPDQLIDCPAGTPIELRIIWFGPEPDPAFVISAAFSAIGWEPWLGRGLRARFTARCTTATPAAAVPAELTARRLALGGAPTLTLRTVTPLALRDHRTMRADLTDPRALITTIRHRAARLASEFGALDLTPLALPSVPLATVMDHTSPIRYGRQGRANRCTPIEGIAGVARFARPDTNALRTLVLGEALCAGRWTAFGAGHYQLEAVAGHAAH